MLVSKSDIRSKILNDRRQMSAVEMQLKSDIIYRTLIKTHEFNNTDNILLYYPINNEVDLLKLFDEFAYKNLYLPKVQPDNKLSIHKIDCLDSLVSGNFGIMEPTNDGIYDYGIIDLALVPLVAFDDRLHRIGYGGGYYDRLLSSLDKCPAIGMAYEMQKIEQITSENHDIPLDMVITECSIYTV